MEQKKDMNNEASVFPVAEGERSTPAGRPSPGWRGLAIAVVVAVVLSVSATLLLGGSFRAGSYTGGSACGSGGPCCPLPAEK